MADYKEMFDRRICCDHVACNRIVATAEVEARQLARDVLAMAQAGGMPDTYWFTDRRILRATTMLGIDREDAKNLDWMIEFDDE